jgi:glyoxylase-like metal-dependent hydrolase (beta-lactamase superfamily II)
MRTSLIATLALALATVMGTAAADPPPATAQFRVFSIGSLYAVALKDGALQEANDGKSFSVGQAPSEVAAVLKSGGAPTDHFEFSIQPLLVRSGSRLLLFDTGAGSNFGLIAGALLKSMQAAQIDPATVTDIFITHAHGDHTGGLLTPTGALTFPNATIHMSAPEWSYLSGMSAELGQRIGLAHVDVLVRTIKPKVVPFAPDAQLIPGLVKAVEIKGHTPGHSGYLIGSGANTLLYIGDSLHSYVVSVREPQWHTAFDADPATAADSRVALVASLAASGQRIYAVHFPFPGVGKIVKQGTHYTWVPEQLD